MDVLIQCILSTRRSSTPDLVTVMTAADTTLPPTVSAVMAVVKSGVPPLEAIVEAPQCLADRCTVPARISNEIRQMRVATRSI